MRLLPPHHSLANPASREPHAAHGVVDRSLSAECRKQWLQGSAVALLGNSTAAAAATTAVS